MQGSTSQGTFINAWISFTSNLCPALIDLTKNLCSDTQKSKVLCQCSWNLSNTCKDKRKLFPLMHESTSKKHAQHAWISLQETFSHACINQPLRNLCPYMFGSTSKKPLTIHVWISLQETFNHTCMDAWTYFQKTFAHACMDLPTRNL